MNILKILRQFANNLNWAQREADLQCVIQNHRAVIDLPRVTANRITVESFQQQKEHHNRVVASVLEKYGNGWSDYLDQYTFS